MIRCFVNADIKIYEILPRILKNSYTNSVSLYA